MRLVLDTNVVVSGVLSPHGPPGRLVDLFLAGDLVLLVDDRILGEYGAVLRRPRFDLRAARVDELMRYVRALAEPVIARPLAVELPDPDDLPFLEVAAAGGAVLVTGNPRHFTPVRGTCPVRVVSAREALALFVGSP